MSGFLLLDDAQKLVTDRLQQYGQDLLSNLPRPQLPSVSAPQVDPNDVIQRLQQHGQAALSGLQSIETNVQQAVQPVVQPVQDLANAASAFTAPMSSAAQDALDELERQRRARLEAMSPLDQLDTAIHRVRRGVTDFTQPVELFGQGALEELERQRQQQLEEAFTPLGRVTAGMQAAQQGDVGGLLSSSARIASDISGTSPYADVSPAVSAGLQRAGVDPTVSQILGQVANLAMPIPGAAKAEGVAGAAERALSHFQSLADAAERDIIPAVERVSGGAVRDFLTGAESQAGSISPIVGARIGGGVAGGIAGAATTPEDADPFTRGAHVVGGALAGKTAPGLLMALRDIRPTQAELDALRVAARPTVTGQGASEAWFRKNVLGQPPSTGDVGTFAQDVVSFGKGNLLSSAATHLGNIATQLVEFAQQPVGRAIAGGESDAIAGIRAAGLSVPEAIARFKDTMRSGVSFYADPERGITRTFNPFLRFLAGTDDFFRTVGESMGRGMEAQRVLGENGRPVDASAISQLVQQHSDRILTAGDTASRMSVFGGGASTGLGKGISDLKNRLLASPSKRDQVLGSLLDVAVPFAVVPDRLWTLGVLRAPGVSEANTVRKLLRIGPGAPRTDAEMRDLLGTGLANSVLNMAILSQVANGNVTGPDDPEHPHSVRINGTWVDYEPWGPMAAQFAIPASIVESVHKTNNLPDAQTLDYASNALNASTRTLMQLGFLDNALNLAGSIGRGDALGGVGRAATQYLDRLVPTSAMLNSFEQAFDENLRDVNAGKPWEREMSRIPGLAGLLPTKISATTGVPELRGRAGPAGVLFKAETQEPDPFRKELNRLVRAGYSLDMADQYPDEISYRGMTVKLKPDEQRAVQQATGKILANFAERLSQPDYQKATEDRKARLMQAFISAATGQRLRAWAQVVGPDEARARLLEGQRVAGRLVNQSAPPGVAMPAWPFLSSSGLSADEQRRQAEGLSTTEDDNRRAWELTRLARQEEEQRARG